MHPSRPEAGLPGYTVGVKQVRWQPERDARVQLEELLPAADEPGILVLGFSASGGGEALEWSLLERWTRSRSVSVAEVAGELRDSALEVALCCDLVYLRRGARIGLPAIGEVPPAGLVWALVRAGRPALARGLLGAGPIPADEALDLRLAQAVLAPGDPLPLPHPCSLVALTAVRDLMRTRSPHAPALRLELATFQLLFATGQPQEGARAFLEGRQPRFEG